jgi:Flp pilus assembly protein CpaB
MSNSKSTRIIAIGVAVFVIGGALLFLVLRGGGSSKAKSPSVATATTSTTVAGAVTFPATTPTTLIQFKIPAGQNAVAVPVDYFAGVGGYVRPGDQINIYAILNKDCTDAKFPSAVKLIFSNVKVLEVIGTPPAASGTAASYLLALSPQDAERLIYNAKFGGLYFTLTTNNEPAATTTGVSCNNPL